MEYIDNCHVKDNKISRNFLCFHVNIEIKTNSDGLYYQLEVSSNNKTMLIFKFYTLEDAVSFTNNVICRCTMKEEILEEYRNLHEHGVFKSLKKE